MRWTSVLLVSAAMAVLALGLSGCGKSSDQGSAMPETKTAVYACSMHPDMMATWAAKCPTCGMDMTKTDKMMPKDVFVCKKCNMMATFETKCPKCGATMSKATE